MDATSFKAALPDAIQQFWNEIEAKSGLTIGVEDMPVPHPPDARMGCGIKGYPAICLHRNRHDPVYPESALHELLHLERYVIHRVPSIYATSEIYANMAGDIENLLEHLVIIPRQYEWNLHDEKRWNGFISNNWDDQQLEQSPENSIMLAKLSWMNTFLCTDAEIEQRAKLIIDKFAEPNSIYDFREGVLQRLHDKTILAKFVISELKLPERNFALYNHTTRQSTNLNGQTLNRFGGTW